MNNPRTSEPDVVAAKSVLRDQMKRRRAALPDAERAAGALRLAGLDLAELLGPPPLVVSLFRSMGDELDTGPLLERLSRLGYRTCLPVMQGRGKPLLFRAWRPGDPLVKVIWGIEEPAPTCPEVEPDVLLMPLLAFDRAGYRLGYGGGFFDRTLRGLRARKAIRTIGLAFAAQEVDAVPHLDYDERIEAVLTPEGLIWLGAERLAGDATPLPG